MINIRLLADYLESQESIFEIRTVRDFFESLQIIGFSRGISHEKNQMTNDVYRFINPNFRRNHPALHNLYKFEVDPNRLELKNTKRLVEAHSLTLIERLMQKRSRQKLSKLDFAHFCLDLALQKHPAAPRNLLLENEHCFEDPDYVKNEEIAGYFGNVSIEDLKNGFQNYFPIYQEIVPVPEVEAMDVEIKTDIQAEDYSMDTSGPSAPKKPKYEKPSIGSKETYQALAFLHKDSVKLMQK